MAIDKSRTPMWMKVVLIFLCITFAAGFVSLAANPFTLFAPSSSASSTATDTVSAANSQYQPQVDALRTQLQSDPESYTVLTALGNAYFDWASTVQQASQTTSSAAGADAQLWVAAKDAYSRAVKVKSDDPPVLIDYAVTQYYSGDTTGALDAVAAAKKINPEFAPAYFNEGIFLGSLGNKTAAIAALQRYLKLDPKGASGNPTYARQLVKQLSGDSSTTP